MLPLAEYFAEDVALQVIDGVAFLFRPRRDHRVEAALLQPGLQHTLRCDNHIDALPGQLTLAIRALLLREIQPDFPLRVHGAEKDGWVLAHDIITAAIGNNSGRSQANGISSSVMASDARSG